MQLRYFLLISVFSAFLGFSVQAQIKISGCQQQPVATKNIKKSINFIAENIHEILNHPNLDRLTLNYKRAFYDTFFHSSFPIVCQKYADRDCQIQGQHIAGFARHSNSFHILHGYQRRGVYLCTAEISSGMGCDFYALIAHEIAHLANLPKAANHDTLGANRNQDLIYALDFAVRDLCIAKGQVLNTYYNPDTEEMYQGP